MKSLLIPLIIILFILNISAQNDNHSNSGRTAPNFKLENLDREIIELNNFVGTGPVLICFWSSCCKSAVAQLEAFAGLFTEYSDSGFTLLAIAVDEENTVAKVKPFVKSKKFIFPVLYDTDGNVSRTYYAFNVPFSVLINKSGKIIFSHIGYMKGDEIELQKKIMELLLE
jgi:cytochrome c biogenesis protein CcmG, thiol:disulfide interchange protein DsbE